MNMNMSKSQSTTTTKAVIITVDHLILLSSAAITVITSMQCDYDCLDNLMVNMIIAVINRIMNDCQCI